MATSADTLTCLCRQCGSPLPPPTGKPGRPLKFCSAKCRDRAQNAVKSKRDSDRAKARWPTWCGHCQSEMIPAQNKTLCSNACKVAAHKARDPERTRAAAISHAAIRRSWYENGEVFDPFEIFERDGWRCHLCGIKTLRSLRGTNDPRAPELDHITPLSKGGRHTRMNTACACKRCNMKKHAKVQGQLRLVA